MGDIVDLGGATNRFGVHVSRQRFPHALRKPGELLLSLKSFERGQLLLMVWIKRAEAQSTSANRSTDTLQVGHINDKY